MTKTTLLLPDDLRERLKTVAARTGRTMTQLVIEGAELALDRHAAIGDAAELRRRAARARETLQAGLFDGSPDLAASADQLLYRHE